MNSKPSVGKKVLSFLGDNLVPIMFIIICAICIPVCQLPDQRNRYPNGAQHLPYFVPSDSDYVRYGTELRDDTRSYGRRNCPDSGI